MVTSKTTTELFEGVKRIISHQREIEKIKGEKFNVFSILKMENCENNTHSAFLGELLNPAGMHLKGGIFLKLFLLQQGMESFVDFESAKLNLEYNIGPRNDKNKTGGRVDIIILDKYQNTICIENKIYAGDQLSQIERYFNFNNKKNKVIYLTLHGNEPSIESKGELTSGKDFILLSYKNDIITWLENCMKEVADSPIVRETIRQYIILLKKMTNTTDKMHETEFLNLILKNFEEAAYVANNFEKAKLMLLEGIRTHVIERLSAELGGEFEVLKGVPINKRNAQIWIKFKNYPSSLLHFGIESFNGDGNFGGNLFVGVFNSGGFANTYTIDKSSDNPKWWYEEKYVEVDSEKVNFSNYTLLKLLANNVDFKKKIIDQIVFDAKTVVNTYKGQLLSHIIKQPLTT